MTEALAPSHITLTRCALLFGKRNRQSVYTLLARNVVRTEIIAGQPKVIFGSLPADKQAQYLTEEAAK